MKLDLMALKTAKTPEKIFSVELSGERHADMSAFEKLAIELYSWVDSTGFFEDMK